MSRDGWYLLDDSTTPLFTSDWVQSRPHIEGRTDWYFFAYGEDYYAALLALTAVGGRLPIPRKYVFGSWYSRYWPYTADEFKEIVREYEQHDFPLDIIVMDVDWHWGEWTGYTWNTDLVPDGLGLIRWLHDQGLRVTLNDHPVFGMQPYEEHYENFMRDMGEDPESRRVLAFDAGSKQYLETFLNWAHAPRETEGVDFWWLDWQQDHYTRSIPELTNLFWLNEQYFSRSRRVNLRGLSFSRWGGWGDHRHPIHFSGDAATGFDMLEFEVPFTATSANVGLYFWSHDTGGHIGPRNEESFARWVQFSSMAATLRLHSTRDPVLDRRPWTYSPEVLDATRKAFHLRSQLMLYIYSTAAQSHFESKPFIRSMYLEYPRSEEAYRVPGQYLLGDHLLIAPIVEARQGGLARQTVWFPEGVWWDLMTHERIEGGQILEIAKPLDQFPVYVRASTPMPMQPYRARMASAPLNELLIRVFEGPVGVGSYNYLYEDDGLSRAYELGQYAMTPLYFTREGNRLRLSVLPTEGSFEGQFEQRTLVFEFVTLMKARAAFYRGQFVEYTYDPTTHLHRVVVPNASIHEAHSMELILNDDLWWIDTLRREIGG